ncbi:hypothetical protein M408DRAFT_26868 [Serendipita vermifera MAFF 305830]|uniref:Uncharacterized protein n=1 Tax=Serendipita vermifera MAFF 305830 TaxID=933852 RepID=A0A0C2WDM5_SERVB|nr:hypothetical protein M408DRAFT_26868 [Serendipita vermifera MAFF 305830]
MANSTETASSTILIVLSHSTIVDTLYCHLSVADMLSLRLVCSVVHGAVHGWLPSVYNVENHLAHFFDDPLSFRILQARTGTIVSGSNALQFFERSYYPNSDLDLYVPCRHTYHVAKWLVTNDYNPVFTEKQRNILQGTTFASLLEQISRRRISRYHGQPLPGEAEYGHSAMEDVFTFVHQSNPDLKVQMIVIDPRSTPIAAVLHFHSTLVMNFITWDRAYSLFPSATFLHRSCLTFGDVDKEPRLHDIYHKYWARGFRIPAQPFLTTEIAKLFKWGVRTIDDRHSWVIKLNTQELLAAINQDDTAFTPPPTHQTAGFTLLNRGGVWHGRGDLRRNPDHTKYRDRQAAIYYRELYSPALKSALTLPYTDPQKTDPFFHIWSVVQAQEAFEKNQAKLADPEVDLSETTNPDEIRDWKYWDKEVLDSVRSKIGRAAFYVEVEPLD